MSMQSPPPDTQRLYKTPEGHDKMTAFYESALERIPVPYESRYLETPFGHTHMLVMGPEDAPPLLLIQGLAGSAVLWHQQAADFAEHFRVYALDTPGQPGRSAPQPLSLFGDDYLRWVLAVIDGLGYERVNLLGISLGAWLIMQLGEQAPERIEKGVLLSPMGLARAKLHIRRWIPNPLKRRKREAKPEVSDNELTERLTVRDFNPGGTQEKFDRLLARNMALATKHFRLDLAMGMREGQGRLRKGGTLARLLVKFMPPMSNRKLRRIQSPMLLILGEHEVLYNPQRAIRRAERHIPHIQTALIENAGHAALYERPAIVNPIIIDYLR